MFKHALGQQFFGISKSVVLGNEAVYEVVVNGLDKASD